MNARIRVVARRARSLCASRCQRFFKGDAVFFVRVAVLRMTCISIPELHAATEEPSHYIRRATWLRRQRRRRRRRRKRRRRRSRKRSNASLQELPAACRRHRRMILPRFANATGCEGQIDERGCRRDIRSGGRIALNESTRREPTRQENVSFRLRKLFREFTIRTPVA